VRQDKCAPFLGGSVQIHTRNRETELGKTLFFSPIFFMLGQPESDAL
jgi:hypothetical protein